MKERILFLDIETVPQYRTFEELPEKFKLLWSKKADLIRRKESDTIEELYLRAGIYSEFGKIICISVGFVSENNGKYSARIKSFFGDDEVKLLNDFVALVNQSKFDVLCGHNGKEFDFPYISRRMIVNGIAIPPILNNSGKKPWEINHKDTMEMWKFGDYKSFVSLDLLATILNIPTPKDDIDGSEVYNVYYNDGDLQRISTYCQKDVATLMKVYYRILGVNFKEEDWDINYF
jgi:DNA polymerase elongation subunit (family B)